MSPVADERSCADAVAAGGAHAAGSAPAPVAALPRLAFLSVALISASLLAYEIVLMRQLLVERWHHFGYLVISSALLGFGASGTLLALVGRQVRVHPTRTLWWSAAGLLAALVLLPRLAATMPVSARFIPADLWAQARWWLLYWGCAAGPFLLGAAHIGAALMLAGPRVGRAYGANLFGSGIGAVGGALLVSRFPLETALWPSLGLAGLALGLLCLVRNDVGGGRRTRTVVTVALAAATVAVEVRWPAAISYDEYKCAARLRHLTAEGAAHRLAWAADPHGYVEIYASDLFHDLPFAALTQAPPPMLSVVINGDAAGSVLRIEHAEQAGALDGTLMAWPYALLPSEPRVLLLDEVGGTNVWLALRQHADHITVVQPNAALMALLRGPLAAAGGHVFNHPDVSVYTRDARAFVSRTRETYDLIQIGSLEGLGVGTAGVRGLAEDHLITVEGLAETLRCLSPAGVLSVSRGIQTPPRENIRLLAALAEALESIGVSDAGRHLIQVRDYLGVCTLALRSPLDEPRRARLRAAIAEFNLTPVWYAGLEPTEVNQPDMLDGPPGTTVDWYHHAATQILSPQREAFYAAWLTNIRPPRDDRPFFWDFFKPGALPVLRQVYGDLWLTRAELGRLFLYASLIVALVAALLLILLPLAVGSLLRRPRAAGAPAAGRPTGGCVIYFSAIGLGFMCIAMALISRAIRLIGDPVVASAVVIGGVLVLSGVGSLLAAIPAVGRALERRLLWLPALGVAALTALLAWWGWGGLTNELARMVLMGLCTVLLSCAMGVPMPAALAALNRRAPALVPWAWGINGVASVLGTGLALVVAMSVGYRHVVGLAAALYLVAGASSYLIRSAPPRGR